MVRTTPLTVLTDQVLVALQHQHQHRAAATSTSTAAAMLLAVMVLGLMVEKLQREKKWTVFVSTENDWQLWQLVSPRTK
jgi:hypothetical protein